MPLTPDFYATLVKFVQAGGIGFGAIVFLLLFILLMRDQPIDPERAKLQGSFLRWGVSFSIIAIVAGLAQNWLQRPEPNKAGALVVTYSPNLGSAGLPTPQMVLLGNGPSLPVTPDSLVNIAGQATLKISADDLIAQARQLQTARAVVATVAAASNVGVAPAPGSPAVPGPDALPPGAVAPTATVSPAESHTLKTLQIEAATSLAKGDYVSAARKSQQLRTRLEAVAPSVLTPVERAAGGQPS